MDNKQKIIIGVILVVVILFIFFLVKRNSENAILELNGGTEIYLYENDPFVDPGYQIVNGSNSGYYVNTEGTVNADVPGAYYIKYFLYNKNGSLIYQATRRVIVLEDNNQNIEMILNGEQEEYYFIDDYNDKGIVVYKNGIDISDQVTIIDDVYSNSVGDYQVKYQLYDKENIKEIIRYVHIIDYKIQDQSDELKQIIDFIIDCEDYAYTILPDGSKEYTKNITYHYEKEGIYKFDVTLKSGSHREYSVPILSIDHDGPSGTCSLTYDTSSTKITVNATDKSGVSKFTYNGITYTKSTAILDGILGNIKINVYDTKNNSTSMTCQASYGTGFRNLTLKDGRVQGKNGFVVCGTSMTKANNELESLMQGYGYRTRDAVAAAGLYLLNFKYDIPYFWGGKYTSVGFNPKWGCRSEVTLREGKAICSKTLDDTHCELGLDCTGYTAWSFIQAGFDKSLIPRSNQEGSKWGEFNAATHHYAFNSSNLALANQIKPGDVVYVTRKHVGLVIGVSSDTIQVANMVGPIRVSTIKKTNGSSTNGQYSFEGFILMDDFYNMYRNK